MVQFDNCVVRFKELILDELHEQNINCWIAGGALRDYFMGKYVKTDYDIFFPNEEEFKKCADYFKSKDHEIKWESDNGMKVLYNKKTFDLIKLYFDTPEATIASFDFTICMIAVDRNKVYHGETTFIDLAKKQLMIHNIRLPASLLNRSFKYIRKGFWICQGEMKKIYDAIQNEPKKEIKNETETTNSEDPTSGQLATFFFGYD